MDTSLKKLLKATASVICCGAAMVGCTMAIAEGEAVDRKLNKIQDTIINTVRGSFSADADKPQPKSTPTPQPE